PRCCEQASPWSSAYGAAGPSVTRPISANLRRVPRTSSSITAAGTGNSCWARRGSPVSARCARHMRIPMRRTGGQTRALAAASRLLPGPAPTAPPAPQSPGRSRPTCAGSRGRRRRSPPLARATPAGPDGARRFRHGARAICAYLCAERADRRGPSLLRAGFSLVQRLRRRRPLSHQADLGQLAQGPADVVVDHRRWHGQLLLGPTGPAGFGTVRAPYAHTYAQSGRTDEGPRCCEQASPCSSAYGAAGPSVTRPISANLRRVPRTSSSITAAGTRNSCWARRGP